MIYHLVKSPGARALLIVLSAFIASAALSGCAMFKEPEDEKTVLERLSAEQIYSRAEAERRASRSEKAAELFLEIERLHPYSPLALEAQLVAAQLYYDLENFDSAANAAERFIQLRPSNERAPYAYYIRALSYFDQIAESDRSQKSTLLAKEALQEVASRFPDTRYGLDAAVKLDLVNEQLAGSEMTIARYYQDRDRMLAAANRYNRVIELYDTTSQVEEALHRLVEVYLTLGLRPEATRAAEILGHNYPGSRWYARSYALLNGEDQTQQRFRWLP